MNMKLIVATLRREKDSKEQDIKRIDAALNALGQKGHGRVLSTEARRRIAAAQRLRWRNAKKAKAEHRPKKSNVSKISEGWTPARRRAQALRMKANQRKLQAGRWKAAA